MKVYIKTHLCLIFTVGIIASMAWGYTMLCSLEEMNSFILYPSPITLDIFVFIAPFFMMGGLANGYYLLIRWMHERDFHGKYVIIAIGCTFLFPIIAMMGLLSMLPLIVVDLIQLLLHHYSYSISFSGGNIIKGSKQKKEMLVDNSIKDIYAKEVTEAILLRKKYTRMFLYVIGVLWLFLLGHFIDKIYLINPQISTIIKVLSMVFTIFVYIFIALIVFTLREQKAVEPLRKLLRDECDPYRVTMVVDYLLEHKKIGKNFGEMLLLESLKEQDDYARMQHYINPQNSYLKTTNRYVVFSYYARNKEDRHATFMTFYQEDKAILENLLKKHKKKASLVQQIQFILLDLEAMKAEYEGCWQEAISLYKKNPPETRLDHVRKNFHCGTCYMHLKDREHAKICFLEVIEEGNTTCYVEEAKALLSQMEA